jgi:hypothetical protein
LKLQASSNDIVIRNLNFDEMWQWDDGWWNFWNFN